MENFNNDDVKKMLEMLREHAESTNIEEKLDTQTTESTSSTEEDIKDMLKKQFSAEKTQVFEAVDDYSFDTEDFTRTGEVIVPQNEQENREVNNEVIVDPSKEIAEEPLVEVTENSEASKEDIATELFASVDEKIELEDLEEAPAELAATELFNAVEEKADEAELETASLEYVDEPESNEEYIEDTFETPLEENVDNIIETVEETEEKRIFEAPERVEQIEIITPETEPVDRVVEEVLRETDELVAQTVEEIENESFEQVTRAFGVTNNAIPDSTMAFAAMGTAAFESINETINERIAEKEKTEAESELERDKGPLAEESINYDEVLEGQQGTVFNNFVEDFTGDLDDVVFEAEITASHAPVKQYTILEDWEQIMREKQYNTAEEGIIPPTEEELAYSAEIAARAARANTDYFTPVTVPEPELDEVDIALMVALGGEDELNQTVGFEKIRQAVNDELEEESLDEKSVYGYCGEEYSSLAQNLKIKKKYRTDKIKLIIKASVTALIALILLGYEIAGWAGVQFSGIFDISLNTEFHILFGLQLLFIAIAISGSKLKKFFKNMLEFSSLSFIGAMVISVLCILHDFCILILGYSDPANTVHSLAALLLLLSLIYDIFDVYQQAGVFEIVSKSNKKLVLEPYGKLRMSEEDSGDEVIDKDSYCISRVNGINNFFARTTRNGFSTTGKLVSLVLSLSIAFCVMLVLLLMNQEIGTIVFSLIVTLSFSLIIASVFESEFAFFAVYNVLKKYRTGIIGKSSVAEYGKSNIVYFDDFNVFNKKSVRTKGLKLYDNNEIYRILYHTQAVFSKVGGPLKGVFEYATTEMAHSRNVEIKEISKEGIYAMVDSRTSVLIGTGSFMKLRGIHPTYTSADLKLEKEAEESIMFIALNGTLGAKLYVTYKFSSEFERLAKKLALRGIGIGIRSADPNVNDAWAKKYGELKKCSVSVVRPTVSELKPSEKSIECGIVSTKNVRALSEALIMCTKLDAFEGFISKIRAAAIVLIGILTFALMLFPVPYMAKMLLLMLASALGASVMMLLTHYYIKK